MRSRLFTKLMVLFVFGTAGLLFLGSNIFYSTAQTKTDSYEWRLAKGFPVPRVPDDNSMTTAKVELGRHLFYDKRLSINEKHHVRLVICRKGLLPTAKLFLSEQPARCIHETR